MKQPTFSRIRISLSAWSMHGEFSLSLVESAPGLQSMQSQMRSRANFDGPLHEAFSWILITELDPFLATASTGSFRNFTVSTCCNMFQHFEGIVGQPSTNFQQPRLCMVLGSGHPLASYIGAQPTANLHIRRHDFAQGVLLNGLLFRLGEAVTENRALLLRLVLYVGWRDGSHEIS